ncbi:hypothetical protein MIND_00059800 [Mycena indigotica]|uniref:C2H2-type domain-containing protein n=1 Tax=Mycena indigotica TaxID=2126181 RepID=A0A8H6WE81_9AGAR|nr:uncharacterized protein MIND_00059800 [Mycena indigotica]KAF7315449.1 hypothetical protein MIND_00059800 [Mycena indigotica]
MPVLTGPTLLLPPLASPSPMSYPPSDPRRGHERPVLPPIQDLIREISSPRAPPESPATTLARLRVNEEDRYNPATYPRSSSSRPPSRSHPDPSSYASSTTRYHTVPYDRSRANPGLYPDYQQQQQQQQPRTVSYDRAYSTYDPRPGPSHPQGYYPPPTMPTSIAVPHYQPSGVPAYATPESSATKYECPYCGKGFTRPSSLKIHLNSHTGEKPFVCPVEGCGRSFSVLSNMRRHARVHVAPSAMDVDGTPSLHPTTSSSSSRTHRRRTSSASSNSRRSHSVSSDEEEEDFGRPEQRTRQGR